MATADRLLQFGGALFAVGGGAVVAYDILARQDGDPSSFWSPFSVVGVVLLAIGLVGMLIGFFWKTDKSGRGQKTRVIRQRQRGGSNSTNVQVGGDFSINDERDRNPNG